MSGPAHLCVTSPCCGNAFIVAEYNPNHDTRFRAETVEGKCRGCGRHWLHTATKTEPTGDGGFSESITWAPVG